MPENNGNNHKQGGLSWSTPAQSTMPVQKTVVVPKVQVMPPSPSNSKKYIIMIVLGVIAGIIIAWGWSVMSSPKEAALIDGKNPGADTSSVTVTSSGLGLTIISPQIAGNSVAVAAVSVTSATWIVIYEDNNGKPGNALGAALFFPESTAGTVELLRGTTAGKSYLATEQVDNGDRKFSLKDDQFRSVDGTPQWVTFEVK